MVWLQQLINKNYKVYDIGTNLLMTLGRGGLIDLDYNNN